MRQILQRNFGENDIVTGVDCSTIIAYGCSAHMLNLLSADVEVSDVKDEIVTIAKYFRNRQRPAAWFKTAGGSNLSLPIDVRWNTVSDAILSFLKNRGILVQVCQDHKDDIDPPIVERVNDVTFANKAKIYTDLMKPISVALDRAQSSGSTISVCVEIWHKLGMDLSTQPDSVMKLFDIRRDKALSGPHYLANIIDNRFRGRNLSGKQKDLAYTYLSSLHSDLVPLVMAVECGDQPFASYLFKPNITRISPMTWWKVAAKCITDIDLQKQMLSLCTQLMSAVASTAGLERVFSTFGLVQSKLRNRLGNDKAAKITFLVRALNQMKSLNDDAENNEKRTPSNTTKSKTVDNLDWVCKPPEVGNEQASDITVKSLTLPEFNTTTGSMDMEDECYNTYLGPKTQWLVSCQLIIHQHLT